MPDDRQPWQPLTRVEFRQLQRGQQVRQRRGPVWTVHVAPHGLGDGLEHVVLRAGARVRHVDERFADDYALVPEGDAFLPAP